MVPESSISTAFHQQYQHGTWRPLQPDSGRGMRPVRETNEESLKKSGRPGWVNSRCLESQEVRING